MSSILDALKKAEQEAGGTGDRPHPWPSPLPVDMAHRKSLPGRWWLLVLALIAVAGACAALLWPFGKSAQLVPELAVRQVSPAMPVPAVSTRPASDPSPTHPVAVKPVPPSPSAEAVTDPANQPKAAVPPAASPSRIVASAPSRQPPRALPTPTRVAPAARKAVTPPPVAPRTAEPVVDPAPPTTAVKPAPQPVVQRPPPVRDPAPPARQEEKVFRDDPRIELQALVWAPDAAQRFVVVNNRLIREGGSVDNIVILKIDPDDVLLSEGADRWHQKFTIR